jgi:hypothetical protein
MSTTDRASEGDTNGTKERAGGIIGTRDPPREELTDQDRADMKRTLEEAGYKVKDAISE